MLPARNLQPLPMADPAMEAAFSKLSNTGDASGVIFPPDIPLIMASLNLPQPSRAELKR